MPKKLVRQFDGLLEGAPGKGAYEMAIRSRGDFVFLMGQGGYDLDGKFVGGDPGAQAAQASRNIRRLLTEAGGRADLCKLTVYMTDLAYRKPIYTAIEREFEGTTFCRTGMVVASLGPPEYLVEIDAFAVIDG
jgi:enamine deaminase RidA (YjgF/YER057c/UK114 family)